MKIAFVADDIQTISAHFGRAPHVVVVTLEDGQEVSRELRAKEAHGEGHGHTHVHDHDHDHAHGHGHAHDHGHHHKDHTSKFSAMEDCDVMVVRGIGSPAISHAERMGLEVYLTRESSVDAALAAYLSGNLDHDARRIHHH
jgi:predicted Fe-Mo cluster-binding NifX family protein